MNNRKVDTAPVQPKHPTHRKPGDFEPQGATKTPPIVDDPPHTFSNPEDRNDKGKGHR